ncbi:MAG: 3-dehydroquinate synthase family protein [Acidobacteriota bacterium]|nr:3-dehydroquinate synthase family protein [Acidobacteriota bacterium]
MSAIPDVLELHVHRHLVSHIVVGRDAWDRFLQRLTAEPTPTAVVTHPSIVETFPDLAATVRRLPDVHLLTWPEGEATKSWDSLRDLLDELFRLGFRRDARLVAWGGGVLGDLVGLAAALYMRGIHLWHVPTTLTAQTDSAIGGKTAVDTPFGKNLVGTFYPAEFVWVDPHFLMTLPEVAFRDGMGEVIKYAFLIGEPFLSWLEASTADLQRRDPEALETMARTCAAYKVRVVQADEQDWGMRQWLNLGHTVGHALEAMADYRGLTHGEAVLWGLVAEGLVACRRVGLKTIYLDRLHRLIEAWGGLRPLPTWDETRFWQALELDKKQRHGTVGFRLPLLVEPGRVEVVEDVSLDLLRQALVEAGLITGR